MEKLKQAIQLNPNFLEAKNDLKEVQRLLELKRNTPVRNKDR
jgi:hypothetical protein